MNLKEVEKVNTKRTQSYQTSGKMMLPQIVSFGYKLESNQIGGWGLENRTFHLVDM